MSSRDKQGSTTMALVEKEITMKNVERARNNSEFEKRNEAEHKLIPENPAIFECLFKPDAIAIEQLYLSSPDDEFSLRLRATYHPEGTSYTATQKDRGEIVEGALHRTEIDTPINEAAYDFFAQKNIARLRKLRATIAEGISIDFYDSPEVPVIVEVEHNDPVERTKLVALVEELTSSDLIDHSSDPSLTNEALAHHFSKEAHPELIRSKETLDTFAECVVGEMIARYATGKRQVVAGLTGMSGSGKTTVTRLIEERLVELFGEAYKPIIISTDDYHFGKTNLEERYGKPYSDWDSPRTYNTEELALDLHNLAEGTPLIRRHFSFETEEPVFDELVAPLPFILIEGLYAGSKDLTAVRDLHFELPTSIATSVGRDVRRLVIDNRANRAFPTPESRLRYQIETALPLYMSQERPSHAAFSASARPLAERAFMLSEFTRSKERRTQELQG